MFHYTSEIHAAIITRDAAERDAARNSPEIPRSSRIVSIPNGQVYGEPGHIPCDHYIEFLYLSGKFKHVRSIGPNYQLKWFDGPVKQPHS